MTAIVFCQFSVVVFCASPAVSAELEIQAGTSYVGEEISKKVFIFDKIPKIESHIHRILSSIGAKRDLFQTYSGTAENAATIRNGNTKYIVYNQDFFDRLQVTLHFFEMRFFVFELLF